MCCVPMSTTPCPQPHAQRSRIQAPDALHSPGHAPDALCPAGHAPDALRPPGHAPHALGSHTHAPPPHCVPTSTQSLSAVSHLFPRAEKEGVPGTSAEDLAPHGDREA
ncbi:unnamed protein product [Rangifer tarandus platyrhynchus]|uniref:Uncharacterized protein n=1 Tax=Rangifer tarandus platyrhynchus TaxID=3082113 RepID=A0AC59ZCV2_RANTA